MQHPVMVPWWIVSLVLPNIILTVNTAVCSTVITMMELKTLQVGLWIHKVDSIAKDNK